ncbi:MAG TPA: hypothetical protein PLJ50_03875 [Candidatus Latescibacteria bacterium]|nr:hypothetical protein [Candidatus Latescibacterota bacterium]
MQRLTQFACIAALFWTGTALASDAVETGTGSKTPVPDSVRALPPPLPTQIRAADVPSDNGKAVVVTWLPDASTPSLVRYQVGVATNPSGPYYFGGEAPAAGPLVKDDPKIFGWSPANPDHQFLVVSSYMVPPATPDGNPERVELRPDQTYYLRFAVVGDSASAELAAPMSVTPRQNWIKLHKLNNLIFGLFFGVVILSFIEFARRNPNMFIRKIAGLDAVEEALGRATEMGKPVYFVHGLNSMGEVSAIASVNILGRVARRVAQFDTTLKVMNNDPIVLAVSQEVVREACIDVGRPDAYVPDNVMFVADRQFSYAAAVDGMMMRERPATVMLMGYFYAEALLFAETGNVVGAIQIAATDSYTQIPFFITTCDYTLIGEELYAASAYLAREPKLLGSLRGQDVGKAVLIAILTIGTALELAGIHWLTHLVAPL